MQHPPLRWSRGVLFRHASRHITWPIGVWKPRCVVPTNVIYTNESTIHKKTSWVLEPIFETKVLKKDSQGKCLYQVSGGYTHSSLDERGILEALLEGETMEVADIDL